MLKHCFPDPCIDYLDGPRPPLYPRTILLFDMFSKLSVFPIPKSSQRHRTGRLAAIPGDQHTFYFYVPFFFYDTPISL